MRPPVPSRRVRWLLLGFLGIALVGALARPELRQVGADRLAEGRATLRELGGELSDAHVTARVRTALELRRELRDQPLEVSTDAGVVTLSGQAGSDEVRELAQRVVGAVPGVRAVHGAIEVRPELLQAEGQSFSDRARDRRLEAEGRLAFSLHRELSGSGLELHAEGGQLAVSGKVESNAQRRLALEVAGALPHAQGVRDEMFFGCAQPPVPEPALDERAQKAQRALATSPHLAGYGLSIRVQDGRLVLEGLVASGIEKDLAEALAERAAGQEVEDALQVRS